MKKKLYTIFAMVCLLIASSISLVACGHEHDYASLWKSDETNHWHECTVDDCDEVSDKSAHTAGDWIIDTNETHATDGTKHKECTVCGYIMETATIDATGLSIWNGTVTSVSEQVDGVIEIDSAEELAGVAVAVNNGTTYEGVTLKLMYNIDLSGYAWTPIGDSYRKTSDNVHKFMGTFDGNNKYITGLTNSGYTPSDTFEENNDLDTYGYGLFGYTENATIKDLTITVNINTNATDLQGDSVGAIVGYAKGGLNMSNCVANGTVNGGFDAVGGLVGRANYSTTVNPVIIENCTNNANVTSTIKTAGVVGFLGKSEYFKVNNCTNNGAVSSFGYVNGNFYSLYVGGILNYEFNANTAHTVIVTNCANHGNLNGITQIHSELTDLNSVAFVANLAGTLLRSANNATYDFTGNTNTGKSFAFSTEPETLIVSAEWQTHGYASDPLDREFNNERNNNA